jgi:uncharacterized membrane protein
VLDQLHELLLMIGTRPFPNGWHADEGGNPRLFVPVTSWDNYVALAFEEIRLYGAGSVQVVRRLRHVIADLCRELPEGMHPPLQRQLALLDSRDEEFVAGAERKATRYPDAQGIGSGAGFDLRVDEQ